VKVVAAHGCERKILSHQGRLWSPHINCGSATASGMACEKGACITSQFCSVQTCATSCTRLERGGDGEVCWHLVGVLQFDRRRIAVENVLQTARVWVEENAGCNQFCSVSLRGYLKRQVSYKVVRLSPRVMRAHSRRFNQCFSRRSGSLFSSVFKFRSSRPVCPLRPYHRHICSSLNV
jgi:hypothetical protein